MAPSGAFRYVFGMANLFQSAGLESAAPKPLAEALRPAVLEDVVGQSHLIGPEGPIGRMLGQGRLSSMILWGPPGVGKTTIARLLADKADLEFVQLSAVFSGVADLRKAFEAARMQRESGRGTLLFVDEIHRFNRAQQDGFLPYVEEGVVTLVGATTENPSFELNGALLSRAQVFILNRLDDAALNDLLDRAASHIGRDVPLDQSGRDTLIGFADGDGRYLLTLADEVFLAGDKKLDAAGVAALLQKRAPAYDKSRDEHYNIISALHKSMRGSDPDAALYWYARMIYGGEDPRYIARRLVRFASEDIGLADPTALMIASEAARAYERLGSPEGDLALAHAVVHLATAPKSIGVYAGYKAAMRAAKETGSLPPPKHILNAPTKLMKDIGYGDGYAYDPNTETGFSGQNYFPDGMTRQVFYAPKGDGREAPIKAKLEAWEKQRNSKD